MKNAKFNLHIFWATYKARLDSTWNVMSPPNFISPSFILTLQILPSSIYAFIYALSIWRYNICILWTFDLLLTGRYGASSSAAVRQGIHMGIRSPGQADVPIYQDSSAYGTSQAYGRAPPTTWAGANNQQGYGKQEWPKTQVTSISRYLNSKVKWNCHIGEDLRIIIKKSIWILHFQVTTEEELMQGSKVEEETYSLKVYLKILKSHSIRTEQYCSVIFMRRNMIPRHPQQEQFQELIMENPLPNPQPQQGELLEKILKNPLLCHPTRIWMIASFCNHLSVDLFEITITY